MADSFTGTHPCCELVAFQLIHLLFFYRFIELVHIEFNQEVKEGRKVYMFCLKLYKSRLNIGCLFIYGAIQLTLFLVIFYVYKFSLICVFYFQHQHFCLGVYYESKVI